MNDYEHSQWNAADSIAIHTQGLTGLHQKKSTSLSFKQDLRSSIAIEGQFQSRIGSIHDIAKTLNIAWD
jgi:hypothetical protein